MERLLRDIRHAVARLDRDRGFATVTILTLALGIGANTAVFSLVQTVMRRPLPYPDPDRLVLVWGKDRSEPTWLSLQEVVSYGTDSPSLAASAGYQETDVNLTGGQEPERIHAATVTPNLFDVLQVPAILGRTATPSDTRAGTSDVIVLGHGLWQRRFGGAPGVVGQRVEVDGRARTVIGVMPAAFRLPTDYLALRPTELWIPEVVNPSSLGPWGSRSYTGVARLRATAARESATSEFALIADRWVKAGFVDALPDGTLGSLARTAVPVHDFITGGVRGALLILLGSVVLVLLIACANVANLQLARVDVRRREMAVRCALGAGRGQIVRQVLTESILLALTGAALGLAMASVGLRTAIAARPGNLPRLDEAGLDPMVLAVTAALAVATGLVFGLLPALQLSRPDLTGALKEGGRSATSGPSRQLARRGLVVLQLASSVVLTLAAGLLMRSLIELNRIDLGFNPANILTAQLNLPITDYPKPADVVRFYRELGHRVAALPGVQAAGAVRVLPLSGPIGDWSIKIEGRPYIQAENPNGDFQAVTPGYFEAMHLGLVRGRFLNAGDQEGTLPAVVINDTMAARYWPGEDAVGRKFMMGTDDKPWLTIVGIVRTVRHNAVIEQPRAEMYVAHAQLPGHIQSAPRGMTLVIKTNGHPLSLADGVRDTIRSLDRHLPVSQVRSMEEVAADSLSRPRFVTFLLGTFATIAVTLAAIGIYGTISLLVTERTQEMGIRIALGAERGSILRLVLGQGLLLTSVGVAVGLAGATLLARTLAALVYGVGTLDPLTFAVVPAVLCAVALLACLFPAWRAATVDPMTALRRS
ncbi:MAG: ABC transporter permease [Acidobacteriota bacterium]